MTEAAPACEVRLTVAPVLQTGPLCVAASTVTAMSARGEAPSLRDLARSVVVHKDGVDLYDLQRELATRGWGSLVFTGPPEAGARLVEARHAPVVFVHGPSGRHAWTLVGVRRAVSAEGCGSLTGLQVVDPTDASQRWVSPDDLVRAQDGEQWLVAFPEAARDTLDDARFPVAAAEAVDRRFRAGALVRMASSHPPSAPDARHLLEQAVAVDPTSEEARAALAALAALP